VPLPPPRQVQQFQQIQPVQLPTKQVQPVQIPSQTTSFQTQQVVSSGSQAVITKMIQGQPSIQPPIQLPQSQQVISSGSQAAITKMIQGQPSI
jgi:hypothetical protein